MFNELGCNPALLDLPHAGSYQGFSVAGGLGWGLPAALGYKLARPERVVVATVGDGSHMFSNPVACHQVAEGHGLAILTVVFNNGHWNSVRLATSAMYPEGESSRDGQDDLYALQPSPRFETVVEASGGMGLRVESAEELGPALDQAFATLAKGKRQVLVNVLCSGSAYAGL